MTQICVIPVQRVAGREVEQVAALNGVRLRAGCFCNPGCCAGWLGLTAEAMVANYRAGRVCWDDTDIVDGASRCNRGSGPISAFCSPSLSGVGRSLTLDSGTLRNVQLPSKCKLGPAPTRACPCPVHSRICACFNAMQALLTG